MAILLPVEPLPGRLRWAEGGGGAGGAEEPVVVAA